MRPLAKQERFLAWDLYAVNDVNLRLTQLLQELKHQVVAGRQRIQNLLISKRKTL